jgi:hypothetical protein
MTTRTIAAPQEIFQRSLTAHLPPSAFSQLERGSVFIAGLGGGSNIAELLARKGVGRLTIADLDVFEPHNVRQRGSLASTWGRHKVDVMAERLVDINPNMAITPVREGVTLENVSRLVRESDVAVDMLDFHALKEKVALHRAARAQGKTVVTTPSVVNGAVLYVFTPEGPTFEEFFGYEPRVPLGELALRFLRRLITALSGGGAGRALPGGGARASGRSRWTPSASTRRSVLAAVAVENLHPGPARSGRDDSRAGSRWISPIPAYPRPQSSISRGTSEARHDRSPRRPGESPAPFRTPLLRGGTCGSRRRRASGRGRRSTGWWTPRSTGRSRRGRSPAGTTLVEVTTGSTGIALAHVGEMLGMSRRAPQPTDDRRRSKRRRPSTIAGARLVLHEPGDSRLRGLAGRGAEEGRARRVLAPGSVCARVGRAVVRVGSARRSWASSPRRARPEPPSLFCVPVWIGRLIQGVGTVLRKGISGDPVIAV